MQRVKVLVFKEEEDIMVDCPHCEMWESLGIDEPRKRLNAIPITDWHPDQEGKNEVSVHKCTDCNNEFEVEWDYDNICPV